MSVKCPVILDLATGERLSVEWLENHGGSYNTYVVALVRAYRICSGESLRTSKDKIDTCMFKDGLAAYFSVPKLVELFAPWLLRENEADEVAAAKAKLDEDKNESKAICNAIEHACNHWQTLGFDSKLQACESILRNFQL